MTVRLDLDATAIAALLEGDDVKRAVQRRTFAVERRAKQIVHVDTGLLRSRIRSRMEGTTGIVEALTEYAIYEELLHPYLRPSLSAGREVTR